MVDCLVKTEGFAHVGDDPDRPYRVFVRDDEGRRHEFRVSIDALDGANRLSGRCTRADIDPVGVIIFAGRLRPDGSPRPEPPFRDGGIEEGVDFWDVAVPAETVTKARGLGVIADPDVPTEFGGLIARVSVVESEAADGR